MHLDKVLTQNQSLSEDIINLQTRSMRDNRMFFGVDEFAPVENASEEGVDSEDCITVIKTIISEKMHVSDDICIDRAHRIGKKQNGKKIPIVVKFN